MHALKQPLLLPPAKVQQSPLMASFGTALKEVLATPPPLSIDHAIFTLILRTWRDDEWRYLLLNKLEAAFPRHYRIVECYLMTGAVDEYPDGVEEFSVGEHMAEQYWVREGRFIDNALRQQLDEIMKVIGEETYVLDPELDEEEEIGTLPDDDETFGDLPFDPFNPT